MIPLGDLRVLHLGLLVLVGSPPLERDDDGFGSDTGDGVDSVADQGDPAGRLASDRIVVNLQAERFEQPPGQLVGQFAQIHRADRQPIQQSRIGCLAHLALGLDEFMFQIGTLDPQFGAAFVELANELAVDVLGEFEAVDEPFALGPVVGDRPAQRGNPVGALMLSVLVESLETGIQQVVAVLAEDLGVQEAGERVEKLVFADPVDRGVAVRSPLFLRSAGIPAHLSFGVTEQSAPAQHAVDVAAQPVDLPGLGVVAAACGAAGALAVPGDLLGLHEGFQVDQRLMNGILRPDPFADRVGPVVALALAGLAVPHHMSGVFRICDHVPDVGVRPTSHRERRIGRSRWRVGDEIAVEAVGDGLITQPFGDSPRVRFAYHRPLGGVDLQAGLLEPFGAFGRHRVRDLLGFIAVAGFADVVALLGMRLEAVPGLFQHLGDVPLRNALLDPPGQHLGGGLGSPTSRFEPERFIGGD